MTADFASRLDILPPPQRRLWDELAAVPEEFVLYGDTAIALHLGHRDRLSPPVKDRLAHAARAVDLDRLPVITISGFLPENGRGPTP